MSATTATNSLTSTQQREREKQQRERDRQRGLQFQFQDNSVSFLPIANGNVHFSGPIKHEYEDATAKRIKDTLGEFNQMKDYIVNNHKQLTGISTNTCRAKVNNANKAKIEQIFSEMKNNIQPLTGLEDNEIADITEESSSTNHHNLVNNVNVNNSQSLPTISQSDHRKESGGKLKELNLNSLNKHVNNSSSKDYHKNPINKNSLTNHLSSMNYGDHSDQDLLDEVSDDSPSSNRDSQIANNQQSNQIIANKTIHKHVPEQQDKNFTINEDVQSDDSLKRKRTNESVINSSSINHQNDDYLIKKHDIDEEEEGRDKSLLSSDSDSNSSSGSSASSSSDDNLSDSDSVSSSIVRKSHSETINNQSKLSEPIINDQNITNKNNSSKDLLTATISCNSQQQQPRSWALSSFCNNLNNDKLSNLKSPPVTKAQLKQTIVPNENQEKLKNVVDTVVKGKGEQINNKTVNKQISNNYESDDSSSSSSSKLSRNESLITKNKSTKISTDNHSNNKIDNKRTKRSLSPITIVNDVEPPPNKASKKSYSSSIHKLKETKTTNKYNSDKEDKYDKNRTRHSPIRHAISSFLDEDSLKDRHIQSPVNNKKESAKSKLINKELPRNLLVSIDLSTLGKKISKNESERIKSDKLNKPLISRTLIKEGENKKDIDYKNKYRSSDKKSSKDKYSSKNDKMDKYDKYKKYDKTEKHDDRCDKYDKLDKNDKTDKYDKKEKKSKKFKDDEKLKENKKRSAKDDEVSGKESSKHKKSKKESNKKEDRLKESIKNELFDKPFRNNETMSSSLSSKLNKESSKSTSLLDKESNRELNDSKESDRDIKNKDTHLSKDSSTFKEPLIAQKSSSNHHHSKDEIDYYQKEGTRWKHIGDREKDPIKQYCKYLEAALYFLQFGRRLERTNDGQDKSKALYNNTLPFLRSALQNKFAKSRPHSTNENRLSVLGLRLTSLIIFHMNKLVMKDMRSSERNIRSNLASAAKQEDADPSKPDQPLIVNNKMQLSIHLFSAMKKQLDYLSLYNELTELWQQSEHILETDSNSSSFFKKLNAECGQLCLNSNVDDLVTYVKTGLKHLNIDYS